MGGDKEILNCPIFLFLNKKTKSIKEKDTTLRERFITAPPFRFPSVATPSSWETTSTADENSIRNQTIKKKKKKKKKKKIEKNTGLDQPIGMSPAVSCFFSYFILFLFCFLLRPR